MRDCAILEWFVGSGSFQATCESVTGSQGVEKSGRV